jgi:hypothetical protein
MKTSAKLLFLMASMALFEAAIATSDEAGKSVFTENKVAEGQAKTFFSSGGNYYLALNTTYLIYYGVLLGLALLALLALAPLFGGNSADSGYGYQHYQQRHGQENPNSDFHQHQRQRRGAAWDSGMEFSYIIYYLAIKRTPHLGVWSALALSLNFGGVRMSAPALHIH